MGKKKNMRLIKEQAPETSTSSSEMSDSDSDAVDEFTKKFMSKIDSIAGDRPSAPVTMATDSEEESGDVASVSGEDSDGSIDLDNDSDSDNTNSDYPSYTDSDTSDGSHKITASLQHKTSSKSKSISIRTSKESEESDVDASRTSDEESSEEENVPTNNGNSQKLDSDNGSDVSNSRDKSSEANSEKRTDVDPDKSGDNTEDEFVKLRNELANLPFADLQKLKEKIGIKAYNQAMFGTTSRTSGGRKKFSRENKNRPSEMSSKRPVSRFREIVQVKKKRYRDPRFDDLSGEFNEKVFKNSYSFLDDVKQREKQKLLTSYHKEKDDDKKKQLQTLIRRMTQQERADREKGARVAKEEARHKQEAEDVRQGKRPFHLKKAEKRKLELAEKFRELEKSGKVDKYLAKKRKKNAAKDRKRLPNKPYKS